jgi:hypothetical protein
MAMRVTTLQKRLPKIKGWDYVFGTGLVEKMYTPHSFIIDGKTLAISGEYGDNLLDYYGEFNNEYSYIHPELEKWAKKMGGYWEWQNPGAIAFYFN